MKFMFIVTAYRNSVTVSFLIFCWEIACCENLLSEGKNTEQVCATDE